MEFVGTSKEYLNLSVVTGENCYDLKEKRDDSLMAIWNLDNPAKLSIDGIEYSLGSNQIIFLTEFHNLKVKVIHNLRMIRFNRPFYCIIDHDSEVGCKGILFFGASNVPVLNIPDDEIEKFDTLWKMFSIEMQSKDNLQIEMLQIMLKRFLILSTRLLKEQNHGKLLETGKLAIVREFNYLVETNFKTMHSVAEYAIKLNKSPKTLSNLFAQYNHKTPSQIIQERILHEARRLLRYTDKSIKEIAYEIGFEDIQSFSRFFKNKQGLSPKEFRNEFDQMNV